MPLHKDIRRHKFYLVKMTKIKKTQFTQFNQQNFNATKPHIK